MSRDPNTPKLSPLEATERHRQMVLLMVRFGFLILFGTVALLSLFSVTAMSDERDISAALNWGPYVLLAIVIGIAVVLIDVFTPGKRVGTMFALFTGLFAAMLAAVAVAVIIDLVAVIFEFEAARVLTSTAKLLVGIGLAYLCISTVIQTQDDFRLVIPYVEFSKQIRGPRPLLLDTSTIIDARIVELAGTGILQNPIVIPAFVIQELHALADSQDKMKRARGRRGLDVVTKLQRVPGLDLSIDETVVHAKGADMMLVELARQMQAVIVTADVALNRVAGIHNVRILNLNEIANALKPALLPGQQISIHLIRPGEQPGQGVGYLDDGTMVVAEDGGDRIGEDVTLAVTSALQTSAGRLIFGRLVSFDGHPAAEAEPQAAGHAPESQEPRAVAVPAAEAAPISAATTPVRRGPHPPNPPSKRVNPYRNPRR